jgi:ribosomal protein L37AE/L43A
MEDTLPKYRETKSRNSTTKDYGGKVEVKITIPKNTCHPGENVQFHSQDKPPIWTCAKCGKTLLVETVVNDALISEIDEP